MSRVRLDRRANWVPANNDEATGVLGHIRVHAASLKSSGRPRVSLLNMPIGSRAGMG